MCMCVSGERERERDALISREMGTFGISGTSLQAHSNIPMAVGEVFPEREGGRERKRERGNMRAVLRMSLRFEAVKH